MSENLKKAGPDHERFYLDLIALLGKYSDDLSAAEILAVAANMLGKLVAMQDQRTMTEQHAMDIIVHNFELGNKQVVDHLQGSKGNA